MTNKPLYLLANVLRGIALAVGMVLSSAPGLGAAEATTAQISSADTTEALKRLLAGDRLEDFSGAHIDYPSLRRFYELRAFAPAWTGSPDRIDDAQTALRLLDQAGDDGLADGNFHRDQLKSDITADNANRVATYELLLTDAVLNYAKALRGGRIAPGDVYRNVGLSVETFDAPAWLAQALAQRSFARASESLAPAYPEYGRLKSALAKYRGLVSAGGWAPIPEELTAKLPPDDPRYALLRTRLAVEDPTLSQVGGDPQNADLFAALRRYQERNGLAPDGVLGPKTLAMLNVPAPERVAQIEANMERWRWLPHMPEQRYIMVNAADATLRLVEAGTSVLTSRVIVGTPRMQTPILRAVVREVTVNPPWNVPPSIARNEILPKLRRDPNYLASQNMILVNGPSNDPNGRRIDWQSVSRNAFPYRIQQLPGANNALGGLKLEMPNGFNVYLHDTPGKAAFERQERTLSHGCVRVQQIGRLATLALGGDEAAAIAEIESAAASKVTQRLPLKEPLPVYIVYWTALADANGTVQFRPDVYGRDAPLIAALRARQEGATPITTGERG